MKRSERLKVADVLGYQILSYVDEGLDEWVVAIRPAMDFGNGVEPEQVVFEKRVTVFNWRSARFAQARLAVLSDLRIQMRRQGG